MPDPMETGPDIKPMPDPTVLTTEALQREVRSLEESDVRLRQEFHDMVTIRRDAQRRDTDELRGQMRGARKADRRLINAQLAVIHERFKSEQRIGNLIEDQRKERKEDDRRALDAALAAAEKARVADTEASDRANTKTELSTAEQLKQQNSTTNQANANVVTLLNALQTRVEKIENIKQGGQEIVAAKQASSSNMGLWTGVAIAAFVGFNGLILTIVGIGITYMLTKPK